MPNIGKFNSVGNLECVGVLTLNKILFEMKLYGIKNICHSVSLSQNDTDLTYRVDRIYMVSK